MKGCLKAHLKVRWWDASKGIEGALEGAFEGVEGTLEGSFEGILRACI